ncbi:MAG: DUF4197 domain-containing protein [Cyclonatronaceae bacterium]
MMVSDFMASVLTPARFFAASLITSLFFLYSCAELQQFADEAGLGAETPLTEEEVVRGLKEALRVGAGRAAETASERGGYFQSEQRFIAFPPEAQRAENALRDLGFDELVDDFVLTLNRAAEQAAAEAAPVFRAAVEEMTIRDAFDILQGDENAATQYLRRTTADKLRSRFRPVISQALDSTAATQYWGDVTRQYNRIPFVEPVNADLTAYTTDRALEGLYQLLEQEEKAIREHPVQRTSDILRRVFGHSMAAGNAAS